MASGVDAKLLKSTKFPPEYSKKVDMQKVNLEVMKQWITQKVVDILATEDDVVIDFIFGMLEEDRFPDPKKIQLNITGFLEKDTPNFCKQLWNLLLSAQTNPQGVPTELLEKKKEELRLQKLETEKATEQQRLRREKEDTKGREIDNVRQREREERGGGGDGRRNNGPPPPRRRSETPPSSARGSRPSRRDDYSPPPRGGRGGGGGDRYGTRGGRRETDTYIPSSRRETYRRDFDDREGRSYRSYRHHHPRSPPRRSGRDSYSRDDRRPRYSRSQERRRDSRREVSRSRTRSRSRRRSSRDRGGRSRRRSYTPSSHSEPSSVTSRSLSRSSYESSRSRSRSAVSPRKSKRGRSHSGSSDRGSRGARRRHERLPHRSYADTRDKRDRSHHRDEIRDRRQRSTNDDREKDTRRGRDRETTPGTKRQRSVSADESNKRPKDSSEDGREVKEVCGGTKAAGESSEGEATERETQ